MKPEMETFVLELSGKSVDRRAFSEKQARKQKALVETLGGISEEQKEEIRSSLDFVVVDGQGKEYKLTDSEAATKKERGIRPQDQSKIQKAMEKIINTVDQLRAAKDDAGKPLFDGKDLMDEVFTPMVREGLLPETLVIGKFSEVQKLLDAVFPRYRETLEEARVEKAKAKAKTEADYHGAGSTLDMLSAAGTKAGDFKDRFIAKFNPIGTTEEEKQRSFALASATYTAVSSGYDAVSATKDMISGKAIQDATDLLNNVQEEAEASTFFAAFADKAKKVFGLDERKAGIVANYIADGITQAAEKLDQTRDSMDEFLKKKWVQITKASLGVLKEAVESGKETGLTALEVAELAKAMGDAEESVDRQEGVAAVVGKIDGILASVVGDVNPAARLAISGAYTQSVDRGSLAKAATAEPQVDAKGVIDTLADAFPKALRLCSSDPEDTTFERVGVQLAKAFRAKAKAETLVAAVLDDPATAFDVLLGPAEQSVRKSLGLLGEGDASEDPTAAEEMQRQLNDPTARRAMQASVAEVENAGLLDAYERTEDEIAEYERQLVLIDEGGKELASQQSVEKLIAELQKDRKILELVANLGSGLSGLGTGGMEITGKASEKVTEELVGQVAGPLKAAKLIVQLSVNAVKAAERWRLWYKFRQDLQRATTAVSALSSTIQGFYNNKKEQIAFHTIEDALLAVQFAGAVVGSVPEPITLAVGKTMSAVASAAEAANKVVNLAYDEVMLRKAWATTKAAMDNPRDRSLGLEALKINPTLGMHAIAWAGLERQDPIARMVLDSCGLNEQTLADGGTTEKNVRQYLETLLDEDRSLMDPEKLQTDWQPKPLTLTAKDWVIVQGRATKVATPKLRANDTSSVIDALKKTDAHDLPGLNARIGTIDPGDLSRFAQETQDVVDALTRYQPKTDDGDVHEEMSGVLALFLKLANDHKLELARIADG